MKSKREKKGSKRTQQKGLAVKRYFTKKGKSPYDDVEWEERTALIGDPNDPVFEQHEVEVPSFWSQNATNIVAQKYFAYAMNDPRRETSIKQLIDRVVEKITSEGEERGYFRRGEKDVFADELRYILLHQMASFNSPVWFNIGVEGAPQTSSACFILSLEDSLESITEWYSEEARIFQAGSGSGINLSPLRGSVEPLSRGGYSSGPVTFMRAADASAGTIQSGGVTRRAAKMVILDIDHPDVEEFIWCKAREEERIRALRSAGFDMSMDSRNMAESTSYQNANNSVRVTDDFMKAAQEGEEWSFRSRGNGDPTGSIQADKLLYEIAEAAWLCADPGIQYDSTIQDWHTTPAQGRISASNPCSEYMSNDNSSCNLASLNLLRFLADDNKFDIEAFCHAVRIIFLAQEITISFADLPTRKISKNTKSLRQIGIGYTNLGALLMSLGLPYDSDEGRDLAAAITALMTGESYLASAKIAERMGPFDYYEENREDVLRVLKNHKKATTSLTRAGEAGRIAKAARSDWNEVIRLSEEVGVRNAQASVLAPTGTISFMMDCDTTGIEPDFALLKHKVLVGGGTMNIVNGSVPKALRNLGYSVSEVEDIISYLEEEVDLGAGMKGPRGTIQGAPHIKEEDLSVFDCAVGERAIKPSGHIDMMSAVQPFLSGAISKTVNVPTSASVEDIVNLYIDGWKKGLKALAIYRDGSKANQPLSEKKSKKDEESDAEERLSSLLGDGLRRGERREIPKDAKILGTKFEIASSLQQPVAGYIHVRLFEDGTPGGIFIDVGQAGSTLHGFIRAWSVTIGLGLQYGLPLDMLVSKLAFAQFEPAGFTDDPQIRTAKSIVDYVVRWLALQFLDSSVHQQLGILTGDGEDVPKEEGIPGGAIAARADVSSRTVPASEIDLVASLGSGICDVCSGTMVRTGACMTCTSCGNSGGCG
jgi:ribonucleoside-diphosphate reductase alpha chain